MKINKIYISAFGGLKDFTLELGDGLNVIFGNNEDGKTTVLAFIKALFFGTGRSSKSLAESPRQKYTPWDGSTMAGRIYFTYKNKNYCLEKEFRKSDSTDRILLRDTDLGKEIDCGENIGERFFGVSAAAFERSLFIGTGDFIKDGSAAGEINAKLSNIALTGSEDTSYQKIQKTLSDAKNRIISKTGRAGSYAEDMRAFEELQSRLERASEDARKKAELDNCISNDRAEYDALYKKYLSLKSIIDSEQDLKNREKLTEFLETKRQLDALNDSLKLSDGTIINETYAQKIDFCIGKYEKISERCEQINDDISQITEAIELQTQSSPESAKQQIDKLTANVNNLTLQKEQYEKSEADLSTKLDELKQNLSAAQSKKSAVNIAFLIPAILMGAASGASAFLVSPTVAAILCGLAAVMLALSFIIKPKNTTAITNAQNALVSANTTLAESKADKNRIQEEINNLNAKINTLSSVLNADAAVKSQRLADLAKKNDDLNQEKAKAESTKAELLGLLSGFGNTNSIEKAKELLQQIREKTEQQKNLKLQLKTASQFLGNIDYADAKSKLDALQQNTSLVSVDLEVVKAEFESVTEKLTALKEKLTVIATELKTSFKNSENPETLRRELDILKEKLTLKKEFCDAADIALACLEESFYEVRRGYGSELEKQTQAIFSALTDGKYSGVSVSDTLDMSVEKADVFGTRDLDFLSLGTTHQAYLSLRLAIAKLISKDDTLPLFLDDSLSQYDDIRAERAMQFLKEFCLSSQGILFTCHNSICDIAQRQGIEIQRPYK